MGEDEGTVNMRTCEHWCGRWDAISSRVRSRSGLLQPPDRRRGQKEHSSQHNEAGTKSLGAANANGNILQSICKQHQHDIPVAQSPRQYASSPRPRHESTRRTFHHSFRSWRRFCRRCRRCQGSWRFELGRICKRPDTTHVRATRHVRPSS